MVKKGREAINVEKNKWGLISGYYRKTTMIMGI